MQLYYFCLYPKMFVYILLFIGYSLLMFQCFLLFIFLLLHLKFIIILIIFLFLSGNICLLYRPATSADLLLTCFHQITSALQQPPICHLSSLISILQLHWRVKKLSYQLIFYSIHLLVGYVSLFNCLFPVSYISLLSSPLYSQVNLLHCPKPVSPITILEAYFFLLHDRNTSHYIW